MSRTTKIHRTRCFQPYFGAKNPWNITYIIGGATQVGEQWWRWRWWRFLGCVFLHAEPILFGKQLVSAFPYSIPYFLSFEGAKASSWRGTNKPPQVVHVLHHAQVHHSFRHLGSHFQSSSLYARLDTLVAQLCIAITWAIMFIGFRWFSQQNIFSSCPRWCRAAVHFVMQEYWNSSYHYYCCGSAHRDHINETPLPHRTMSYYQG